MKRSGEVEWEAEIELGSLDGRNRSNFLGHIVRWEDVNDSFVLALGGGNDWMLTVVLNVPT